MVSKLLSYSNEYRYQGKSLHHAMPSASETTIIDVESVALFKLVLATLVLFIFKM